MRKAFKSNGNLTIFAIVITILVSFGFLTESALFFHNAKVQKLYRFDAATQRISENSSSVIDEIADVVTSNKFALLTIDDGPRDFEVDEKILDILARHSAKSIWFVNCKNFDAAKNPNATMNFKALLRIRDSGHLIGNHSYNHLDLKAVAETDPSGLAKEITSCSMAIQSATGIRPKYFRPPWGLYTSEVIQVAENAGMTKMLWLFSYDRLFGFRRSSKNEKPPSDQDINQTANAVRSGDIILLHDDKRTADSIDIFLSKLERRGFVFVLPQ